MKNQNKIIRLLDKLKYNLILPVKNQNKIDSYVKTLYGYNVIITNKPTDICNITHLNKIITLLQFYNNRYD